MALNGTTKTVGTVVILLALSSGAYGQETVIYGNDQDSCFDGYTTTSGLVSQAGDGLDQRVYQPMPWFENQAYTVTHIKAIVIGKLGGVLIVDELDFVGRTVTVEFFFGAFDDQTDTFNEDLLLPRPDALEIVLTDEMLTPVPGGDPRYFELDVDVTVPVPAGKRLHVAFVGHFDITSGDEFLIPESISCTGHESAWYVVVTPPLQGRVSEVSGFITGTNAMRVTAQMGVAIPAVSEWGMIAATLLILTAGTLVYRYRMPATVAA